MVKFSITQLQALLLVFKILLLKALDINNNPMLGIESKMDNSTIQSPCGYFNGTHNANVQIYDRVAHNQNLFNVWNSSLQERIHFVHVNPGCEIIFCYPDISHTIKQTRICERFTSFGDVSVYKYLYADTASCSCKKPSPGCDQGKCENLSLNNDNSDTCVQFYKESNCSTCRYDQPYKLGANQVMSPSNNSFSVDSMIVKQNCILEIKSYSIATAYYKGGYYNFVQLAYVQNIKPAEFLCTCHQEGFANTLYPVIAGLVIVILAILFIILTAIGIKYFRIRRKLLKYSEDAIKRFTDGLNSNSLTGFGQINVAFNPEDSNGDRSNEKVHYISLGYLEALQQPYLTKYEIIRDNLTVHEHSKLGEGNFGKVCSGELIKNNGEIINVAIKIAKGNTTNVIYFVSLLDEIQILSYLGSHPNVVCFVGAHTQNIKQRDALLLLELCSNGNLKNYLSSNRDSFLENIPAVVAGDINISVSSNSAYQSWTAMMQAKIYKIKKDSFSYLLKWSQEIASGMEYLSSKNVVHIDLAARNILLTESLTAKISDFGLSRRIQNVGNYAKVGNDYGLPISWISLESLRNQRFTTESDVWSFGVTLWEIFSLGDEPYHGLRMSYIELQNYLSQNKRLSKPLYATDEIYDEMLKCWTEEPSERPSFSELKEFFSK